MERTCGAPRGVFRYPILADEYGTLHDHEVGVNKDGASVYAETGPISLGNGDNTMQVMQIIPDEVTQGDIEMYFKTRFHPKASSASTGPAASPHVSAFSGASDPHESRRGPAYALARWDHAFGHRREVDANANYATSYRTGLNAVGTPA